MPGGWSEVIQGIRDYLEANNPGLRDQFDDLVEDHFLERPWWEILQEIRDKLDANDSDLLARFNELAELRGILLNYVEAIEQSLLSFDPEEDYFEAAFGDVTMLRVIRLLCSLDTIPGRVEDLLGEEGAAKFLADQEEWRKRNGGEGSPA